MQTTSLAETVPSLPIFAADAEFEFIEPKRLVLSPLELCLLSNADDLFEDD